LFDYTHWVRGALTLKIIPAAALGLVAILISGCAIPIVAGLTLNELNSTTSIFSSGLTGKGLTDHAVSFVLKRNCNLVAGTMRAGRKLCEPRGSAATKKDFGGAIGFVIGAAALDMKHPLAPSHDVIFASFP
jgi:hypothetical protein